jgi:hypothetical protein
MSVSYVTYDKGLGFVVVVFFFFFLLLFPFFSLPFL